MVALFVVVNPLGAVPAFLALTTNEGPRERAVTARVVGEGKVEVNLARTM